MFLFARFTDFLTASLPKASKRQAIHIGATLLSLLILAVPQQLLAQNTNGESSTVVYPAEYFAQWAPITAKDMLERIPGQDSSSPRGGGGGIPGGNPSSGGRGLGGGNSGGNEILINGKRTAGKNNQTSDLLARISADQVKEFQIIRGTSGDLDVRGSGQVVNVVLLEELSSSSISYEANVRRAQDGKYVPGGAASIGGQSGKLNYLLSASARPNYRNTINRENSRLGDYSINDRVVEERTRDQINNELSMNLGYDFSSNSSFRVNALYAVQDAPTDVDRFTTNLRVQPTTLTIEREDLPSDRDNWEIGGDYEFTRANGSRFKLLAIANQDNRDTTRERFLLDAAGAEEKDLFLNATSVTEEKIVRGSYTMDIFDGQNIEFGVERAQTTLDSSLALGLLVDGGTTSTATGGLTPQSVSNANSTVEEIRYEPFIIHNWIINSKMSLESTLLYETSEISQSGDVSNTRDFDFVKPKIDFRYNLTPSLQLRGGIEKIVNQLSFADFVAVNDEEDNDAATLAGNASLRQQSQWRYTFNSEYRLPNDAGVLTAEIFYAEHEDVIDRLDVTTDETNLRSANGNIGDGVEYGLNLNASIRMGMINLPNLLVTTGLNLQDSEVTDPFLGIDRRFQLYQRGRFTLTFRHDIPKWRMNWGMQYFDRIDGGMFRYDVDDIEFNVGEPRVNFFSEIRDARGITYRLDLGALTDGSQCRRRSRFVGRISANVLEEIESRCTITGREVSFKVNGTF
ncbi:MAG: TonB-dependent receptor [Gammaproteobacteria bacterium]|nr:TonB-dependent receptor [Gammaproteobacteria bacterium]